LLARMSYVSCDMCLTSQPMMSGACTRTGRDEQVQRREMFFSLRQNAERKTASHVLSPWRSPRG
jgi:hypothetical protein